MDELLAYLKNEDVTFKKNDDTLNIHYNYTPTRIIDEISKVVCYLSKSKIPFKYIKYTSKSIQIQF